MKAGARPYIPLLMDAMYLFLEMKSLSCDEILIPVYMNVLAYPQQKKTLETAILLAQVAHCGSLILAYESLADKTASTSKINFQTECMP